MGKDLGKLARSISIIGVGCTPFRFMLDHPETAGITDDELFAWAALEAMEDAGIESKDIDAYILGYVTNSTNSNKLNPNVSIGDWIGMRGKPSFHIESACATPHIALDQAVMAVASGRYEVVLAGGVEMGQSKVDGNKPAYMRRPMSREELSAVISMALDPVYSQHMTDGNSYVFDNPTVNYGRKYHVTDEQLDDAFINSAISLRRNAARDPLAFLQKEFKDVAKEAGFNDVMAYMKSPHNPKVSYYERESAFVKNVEGAAAAIVCSTEMAKSFRQQPVEILGTGFSVMDYRHAHNLEQASQTALNQVYQITGVKPKEIGLFQTTDFSMGELLLTAEMAGYLPAGEGWRYLLEGQTAFDGDKPINTSGGHSSFGHAVGATLLADFGEVVKQMRGQCGPRQVKKLPETTMVRGMGGSQHVLATILRTVQ